MVQNGPIRELTYEDRARWGECPICRAQHGEACNTGIGIHLGRSINGAYAQDGAHLARLRAAPLRVQEVPV